MRPKLRLLLLLLLGSMGACGSSSSGQPDPGTQPQCIQLPSAPCTPLYAPTFDHVFNDTLHRTCSQTSSCHSHEGHQGGLEFTDESESYALLLGQRDGKARVIPGNASCSELIVRTHSIGKPWQMPPAPGAPLSEGERCALRTWVQQGAAPATQ